MVYLSSAIKSAVPLSAHDLAVLQQVFDRRFIEDEGGLGHRLLSHFHYGSDSLPLLVMGFLSYFVVRRFGSPIMKRLTSIIPTLFLGVCIALLLSVAETHITQTLGRLPMAAELPRGVRFVIFLCWLMIVGAFSCLWQRAPKWAALLAVAAIVCVFVFDQGRWAAGVSFAFRHTLDIQQSEQIQRNLKNGASYAEALQAVQQHVPQDSPIFAEPDAMAVRYRLYRPLAYAFKDGSSYLYSQDAQGAARWLNLVSIRDKQGLAAAWLTSGTQWILCGEISERERIGQEATLVWSNDRWFLAKRSIPTATTTP